MTDSNPLGGISSTEAGLAYQVLYGRCHHPQARPVTLALTGQHVACICVTCYQPLPRDWITNQRTRAERVARCRHTVSVSIRALEDPADIRLCQHCGTTWET